MWSMFTVAAMPGTRYSCADSARGSESPRSVAVAFEVPEVHGIEAHERGEEAPVRLGRMPAAGQPGPLPEVGLHAVERREQTVK